MNKTELLTRLAWDGEERLLLARTMDKLELAGRRNIPAHTAFLSPQERASVEMLINAAATRPTCSSGALRGRSGPSASFSPTGRPRRTGWRGRTAPSPPCGAPSLRTRG